MFDTEALTANDYDEDEDQPDTDYAEEYNVLVCHDLLHQLSIGAHPDLGDPVYPFVDAQELGRVLPVIECVTFVFPFVERIDCTLAAPRAADASGVVGRVVGTTDYKDHVADTRPGHGAPEGQCETQYEYSYCILHFL